MRGFFVPTLLLIAAIGLFVVYTNPSYQTAKGLKDKVDQLDSTLTTSKERRAKRDELLAKKATFTQDDLTKLSRLLPDNVDNIRLIIDVNNIAARHQLTLKNVSLGDLSSGPAPASQTAVGSSGDTVGSVALGFTVNATFDNFDAFLIDLEHSLRLVDVEKVSFKDSTGGANDYTVSIRTYWLH